ncbi:NAD-dependent epimerase/dehydratase family protein [Chloroflexota bacterium]
MTYLVTGGMGYIGCRVVRDLLNDGKEVVCFDVGGVTPQAREVIGEENLGKVKMVQGDVGDTIQVFRAVQEYGVDIIIHHAFSMGPTRDLHPAAELRTNCNGMINMLEAVRLFGLKRVVWTSALASTGNRLRDYYKEPIGDDDALFMPDRIYGATKLLNEVMARLYFDRFGVDSIGLRIARTFGYYKLETPFTEFNRKVALNIPVELVEPDYFNNYIYVEDCADAHVKACDVPTTKTRVFNLKEGTYTNRQLLEAILRVNPEAKVTLVEGISDGVPTPKTDATGLETELKWKSKHSLDEALREIYNYWRKKEGMPLL